MSNDLPPALNMLVAIATIIGALLLILPFTPPQTAIFAFIGVLALGGSFYLALTVTKSVLYDAADNILPPLPEDKNESDIPEELIDQYTKGELTDEEFEKAVEKELTKDSDIETNKTKTTNSELLYD